MNSPPQSRARAAQRLAADPSLSAFVSANAGSGKTTVLVDRVLRLLLAGAEPARILCLTYTKAAAAHMALKVFERLGGFVGLDDDELRVQLLELDGRVPDAARLVRARRLFARAVETPGGLKIETIHAFCERLLHLFPFEANVPARFEVLDEAGSETILAAARTAVLIEAATGGRADLASAFERVSLEAAGEIFDTAIRTAVAEKAFFREGLAHFGGLAEAMAALGRTLGLAAGETVESIERVILEDGLAPAEWPAIARSLEAGATRDRTRAAALVAASAAEDAATRLRHYYAVFFGATGEPRSDADLVTGAVRKADPGLAGRLECERDRVVGLWDRRKAAATLARTAALLTLGDAILARLDALKSARGALDFDDLIAKTRSLLARSDAAWVLYKLDAGIDHVLVDEAQDTNPAQWDILKALTTDFAVGAGARSGLDRTIFAVGDPKQSIFGFQGAEPREFEASGRHYRDGARAVGQRFETVPFTVSFRSAPAVLGAVDAIFARPENFAGLAFELADAGTIGTVHESDRAQAHGRVELWPVVRPKPIFEPEAWTLPVDEPERDAPPVVLARRIARAVRRWTTVGDAHGRVVAPGEILVLVRKRGPLFEAIIRALKKAGVPVAGADRLRLAEHIAVMDLVAAGRAALLPDDDLTLASALKSPFVGLDDDDLVRIGARRGDDTSLAEALRTAETGDAGAAGAVAHLDRWRRLSREHGPFCFYATLLGPLGGRRALVSRLGPEAADAIDEFLSLALAHERRETPSLAAFLAAFVAAGHEVKRDMDAGRAEVRVMTVHGAKGLEADVVVVADVCRVDTHAPILAPVGVASPLGPLAMPVWVPRKAECPRALTDVLAGLKTRAREEHNRLLYVATTRAKDRLVIAPYIGKSPLEPPEGCWLAMVRAGLDAAGGLVEEPSADGGEPILVWQSGAPAAATAGPALIAEDADAPDWLHRPLAAEPDSAPPLRPSGALAAADASPRRHDGPLVADARLIGTLVHALIERLPALPEAARRAAAERFVAARAGRLDAAQRARVVGAALAVLDAPELGPLFGPHSRAEAPIVGTLRSGGASIAVSGQIDRLAVTDDAVLLADFKTTMSPPAGLDQVPETIVAQMAVYRALLVELFPEKTVRAFVVWTTGPLVMELPPARLDAAATNLAARASTPREAPAGAS